MVEVGQTNDSIALVPGSVLALEAIITLCRKRGERAGEVSDTVNRKKIIDDWTGDAADAYEVRVTRLARSWMDAADGLARVASGMRAYRSTLHQAQQRATAAIAVWEYGETLQREEQAGPPSTSFAGGALSAPPVFVAGSDRVAPRSSAEAFAKAAGWLTEARGWVEDAARVAVSEVNAATEILHVDPGSMWATAGAALVTTGPVTPAMTLSVLASLGGSDLASLLAARPDMVRILSQASPEDVAEWWPALGDDQQDAVTHAIPEVVGNLGGVAYRARDAANRIVLDRAIDDAKQRPSENPEQLAALEALQDSAQGRTLVAVQLDTPPLAQIGVGNLDAATSVSFIIPGMNSTVHTDMETYVQAAIDLQTAQRKANGGSQIDYAVIAWLGYHPPMNDAPGDVAFNEKAKAGASALADDLSSMSAVHAATGDPAAISVVAHSYGTNVAALALTEAHADHVVLLGSAGVDDQVDNVADMHVPSGQVFASQADDDGWAPVGRFVSRVVGHARIDPTDTSFGARNFSSEAAIGPSGEALRGVDRHGPFGDGSTTFSYLDRNTTALYNAALATTDRGDEVITGGRSSSSDGFELLNPGDGNGTWRP